MIANAYYGPEGHGPYEMIDIGRLELEEGGSLPNCRLAVATHGRLNAARDNAILVPTWYSGTSKIIEQVYIGKGRALDPEKYFIVVVNQIGNGLSSSPHHADQPTAFPRVRIGDDVSAQHRLLTEHLGIESLALVVGGSMGAQQAYEWAVRWPAMVRRAAAIAGTAKNSEHDFQFTEALIEAITSDPGFAGGRYANNAEVAAGLKRHARIWTVMGWSTSFFRAGRPAALGFASVEAFVDNFMTGYFAPMDPNDLLSMAWKWQRADVSRNTGGDLAAALRRITAKTLVMPISHDMFFDVEDCRAEAAMIPGARLKVLSSMDGHLALFGADPDFLAQVDSHLAELLAVGD